MEGRERNGWGKSIKEGNGLGLFRKSNVHSKNNSRVSSKKVGSSKKKDI